MPNRLQDSTSPYLRQHADNPVDWFPWGQEAFDAALSGDKPVLVSIGYSACHWCHVMAHESFENPAVARLMNEQFVNIKVDREERPDVDSVYMDAVQALTGQGGWPLNIFVTPDRRPFFGGTYWPPAPRHGMPSWPQVLQSIALAWRNDRKQVDQTAASLLEQIGRSNELEQSSDPLTVAILDEAFAASASYFDPQRGGFGGAPKFPQPMNVELLLRTHARNGSQEALDMARLTLDHMAAGGIHDQLGGGFHRYAVDATWTVPHFEKMLYDNAQLARLYTEAWQATHDLAYRRTAEDTLDYLLRDMTSPEGAFYASEDADSGGEEGTFYVWDPGEIARALPPDEVAVFTRRYGVSAEGNFEGKSIPVIAETIDEMSRATGQDAGRVEELLDNAARTLMSERSKRLRPGRDDKILTSWNALAIRAFALAGRAFERPDYSEAATRAAALLLERVWSESDDKGTDAPFDQCRLAHMLTPGWGSQLGFLEDYAFFIEALEELFETTGELRWLAASEAIANSMIARFFDPAGGFFTTDGESARELPMRPKTLTDNALPSGNSSAAMGLLRLAALTGNDAFVAPALGTMGLVAPALGRHALSFGYMLGAVDFHLARKQEMVIVGDPEAGATRAMTAAVFGSYLPNTVRVTVTPETAALSEDPLLRDRGLVSGQPAAYVCEGYVCRAPITDPAVLQARVRPSAPGSPPD